MKYVDGRIVCKVDLAQKNGYTFADGTEIKLERGFDNFDRKYTEQVMGVVVSAENIPTDALVLFHHNSLHETYEITNHSQLSGKEIASGVKYFSIMERDCFFWKMKDEQEWHPTEGFATALRCFEKYTGIIEGIEPKLIPNTLFVTSNCEYKGQIVQTIKASDYCITFRNEKGIDENIIRFRPNGDKEREPEAIMIRHDLTKKLNNGELLVGLRPNDAKPINL